MENKIKFYIEQHIYDLLQKDVSDFELKLNFLINKIVKCLYNSISIKANFQKTSNNKSIVFNLNKHNSTFLNLEKVIKEQNYKTKADFFRDIIYTYSLLAPKNRADIIFKSNKELIENSIKNKKICKIFFHDEVRKVEAYSLLINPDDKFYYLVAYDYKACDLRCFKFYSIKEIVETNENMKFYKEYRQRIIGIEENFDPFLSYGHLLKVKFTKRGIEKYERSPHNRPKLIRSDGNIYEFYCKEFNALVYFPAFLNEVEILEPLEIREKFAQVFSNSLSIYKKN